jgi:hypothetical protein
MIGVCQASLQILYKPPLSVPKNKGFAISETLVLLMAAQDVFISSGEITTEGRFLFISAP